MTCKTSQRGGFGFGLSRELTEALLKVLAVSALQSFVLAGARFSNHTGIVPAHIFKTSSSHGCDKLLLGKMRRSQNYSMVYKSSERKMKLGPMTLATLTSGILIDVEKARSEEKLPWRIVRQGPPQSTKVMNTNVLHQRRIMQAADGDKLPDGCTTKGFERGAGEARIRAASAVVDAGGPFAWERSAWGNAASTACPLLKELLPGMPSSENEYIEPPMARALKSCPIDTCLRYGQINSQSSSEYILNNDAVNELELELELELIQTQMTQKPMLRAEVGMRVRCANKASAECCK